jgi:superfamily II DNA or RNA helicase
MLIKKKPAYQFWNFRDTRKQKFPELKSPELPEVPGTGTIVKGFISHHILLPRKDLPQALIDKFRIDLTLRNPEFLQAMKYGKGFVSYAIPEFVHLYSMDTKYMALPRSVKLPYIYKQFKKCGLTLELEDIRPKFETIPFKQKSDIQPYFYQKDAIEHIINGNVVISLSCGRGKTALALMAVAQIRLKTLIIVRTHILLNQWVESIKKVFDIEDKDIGLINGKTKRIGLITVATEQTLSNMSREEKRKIGEVFGHVCIDEAHESGSPLYRELLTYFKARYMTGLTATPEREDQMIPILKAYIGPIVKIDDLGEFKTKIRLKHTKFHYDFVGKKDKYHELLNSVIHDEDRNQLIVDDIKEFLQEGKVIVCYSNRIEHMEILEQMVKSQLPSSKTDILASRKYGISLRVQDQNKVRESLNNNEINGLFGGKIIEQGFDCQPLEIAILATPSKSRRLIQQVLGRAQREYPGKKQAILCDYIDEKCKILLFQFFAKNKRIYNNYQKEYVEQQTSLSF